MSRISWLLKHNNMTPTSPASTTCILRQCQFSNSTFISDFTPSRIKSQLILQSADSDMAQQTQCVLHYLRKLPYAMYTYSHVTFHRFWWCTGSIVSYRHSPSNMRLRRGSFRLLCSMNFVCYSGQILRGIILNVTFHDQREILVCGNFNQTPPLSPVPFANGFISYFPCFLLFASLNHVALAN